MGESISRYEQQDHPPYEALHMCRLVGHEGSIFRIAWSSDGSKLVSVSDDRRLILVKFAVISSKPKNIKNFEVIQIFLGTVLLYGKSILKQGVLIILGTSAIFSATMLGFGIVSSLTM